MLFGLGALLSLGRPAWAGCRDNPYAPGLCLPTELQFASSLVPSRGESCEARYYSTNKWFTAHQQSYLAATALAPQGSLCDKSREYLDGYNNGWRSSRHEVNAYLIAYQSYLCREYPRSRADCPAPSASPSPAPISTSSPVAAFSPTPTQTTTPPTPESITMSFCEYTKDPHNLDYGTLEYDPNTRAPFCKFKGGGCPINWKGYQTKEKGPVWTKTQQPNGCATGKAHCDHSTAAAHTFGPTDVERCTVLSANGATSSCQEFYDWDSKLRTVYASYPVTEIGCVHNVYEADEDLSRVSSSLACLEMSGTPRIEDGVRVCEFDPNLTDFKPSALSVDKEGNISGGCPSVDGWSNYNNWSETTPNTGRGNAWNLGSKVNTNYFENANFSLNGYPITQRGSNKLSTASWSGDYPIGDTTGFFQSCTTKSHPFSNGKVEGCSYSDLVGENCIGSGTGPVCAKIDIKPIHAKVATVGCTFSRVLSLPPARGQWKYVEGLSDFPGDFRTYSSVKGEFTYWSEPSPTAKSYNQATAYCGTLKASLPSDAEYEALANDDMVVRIQGLDQFDFAPELVPDMIGKSFWTAGMRQYDAPDVKDWDGGELKFAQCVKKVRQQ